MHMVTKAYKRMPFFMKTNPVSIIQIIVSHYVRIAFPFLTVVAAHKAAAAVIEAAMLEEVWA